MSKQAFNLSFIAALGTLLFAGATAHAGNATAAPQAGVSFSVIPGFLVELDLSEAPDLDESERPALVAVFLYPGAQEPAATAANKDAVYPPEQTSEVSHHLEYHPELQQKFIVGNGKTDSGAAKLFMVPEGATRMVFVNLNANEWSNRWGGFNIQLKDPTP